MCCIQKLSDCKISRSLESGIRKFFTQQKTYSKCETRWAPPSWSYSVFTPSICLSSLLCTTFEYCTLPAQTTYIGTPLCRRARTHEFKLPGSYMGLKQASRLCEHGAILITTVHIQSQVTFPVSHYTQFGKNCQEALLWLRIRVKHNLTLTLSRPQLTLPPVLAINGCSWL